MPVHRHDRRVFRFGVMTPVLLPTIVALAGGLRQRGRNLIGMTMLVVAPQLALIEVILAMAALMLPYVSILYGPRPVP